MYPGNLPYRYTDLYFTTATVRGWKQLLMPDKYKTIITDSMAFLVQEQTVRVYAFVIMPNHFHLIWQMAGEQSLTKVQLRFMKYIAQQIKADLMERHPKVLEHFKVFRKDRQYHFFKERPLSVPLFCASRGLPCQPQPAKGNRAPPRRARVFFRPSATPLDCHATAQIDLMPSKVPILISGNHSLIL